MNKIHIKILILIIAVVLVLKFSLFESNSTPVLYVITQSETTHELEYIGIRSKWKSEKTSRFESDDFHLYKADPFCFISDVSNNKVRNKLNKIVLKDSKGNTVDNDEMFTEIFQSAEKIKHDIWEFQVIKSNDDYFALVKLNVNWQSPCDFYKYDKTKKELELLHRFDAVDIVGLSFPSREGESY